MKLKIEGIKVEATPYRTSISWRIDDSRFHVWLGRDNTPDETVFKNSIAGHREPGYHHTRHLNRITSKTTAAMFSEVWAIVERDNLIAKALDDEATRQIIEKRKQELQIERNTLEVTALDLWKQGKPANHLHPRYFEVINEIAAIELERTDDENL